MPISRSVFEMVAWCIAWVFVYTEGLLIGRFDNSKIVCPLLLCLICRNDVNHWVPKCNDMNRWTHGMALYSDVQSASSYDEHPAGSHLRSFNIRFNVWCMTQIQSRWEEDSSKRDQVALKNFAPRYVHDVECVHSGNSVSYNANPEWGTSEDVAWKNFIMRQHGECARVRWRRRWKGNRNWMATRSVN